jgi:hypothetical protein
VAAGAIDGVVVAIGLGGGAAAIAAAVDRARRGEPLDWTERLPNADFWAHPALTGALRALQLTGRNWRSPGMRITRIQNADARTHGPVSFRSASVALLFQTGSGRIGRTLDQPAMARAEARRLAADDEVERMRASRPDGDPEELRHDELEIRRRLGENSCTWMLPRMLVRTAIEQLPALWSGRRQTLTQRLAGTTVVLDR